MKSLINLAVCLMVGLTIVSCSKIKTTEAEAERKNWIEGFKDSVDYYQNKSSQIEEQLAMVNSRIAAQIQDFELVKKPREVSGYYLLKGWETKLPLTSTGIYARINENEKLELIATLAGNTFNCISVDYDGVPYSSEIVPHDQAFNFRHERFNTVCFSGGKADTIAWRIAQQTDDKVNLTFIEGSKKKNFQIPANEKELILKTWNLYSSQLEARKLQRELWINARKIETFRRIADQENTQK